MAQVITSTSDITIFAIEYNELFQLLAANEPASPVTSVAQSGNPITSFSQSSSIGLGVLDSDAFDYMTGNQYLFFP